MSEKTHYCSFCGESEHDLKAHQRPIGAYLRCVRRAVRGPARGQGALAASCLQF